MVTVVAIRGGCCAVCVDDCGKSLTLPLDRLPVGTVAGSRLSLEAVLGLPASATLKNRGADKSGAPAFEPSTLARHGVGGASGGHKGRRMIVTEVRDRRVAVLVAENGATWLRSIFELPGRIRPGDVFLVAEAHVERDRDCEQWSDEHRRKSVARAQQLRLHPFSSDSADVQQGDCACHEAQNRSSTSPSAPVHGSPDEPCQSGWFFSEERFREQHEWERGIEQDLVRAVVEERQRRQEEKQRQQAAEEAGEAIAREWRDRIARQKYDNLEEKRAFLREHE